MNNNAYHTGGIRVEPLHGGRWNAAGDNHEMTRRIERLLDEILSKDQVIAVLNDDIYRLQRSTESNLITGLRRELLAKDQEKDVMERRYTLEVAELRRRLSDSNLATARKDARITQLEADNARLQRLVCANAGNTATVRRVAELEAELNRTRAELVRARGW